MIFKYVLNFFFVLIFDEQINDQLMLVIILCAALSHTRYLLLIKRLNVLPLKF